LCKRLLLPEKAKAATPVSRSKINRVWQPVKPHFGNGAATLTEGVKALDRADGVMTEDRSRKPGAGYWKPFLCAALL
jgi:hypothetical protein